ncbi:MAG: glycosyltransferase [Cyanobacteria bacterium P01_H01_bin.21]
MRIVIDLQGCQSTGSRTRGIGRYSMAIAKAMAEQAPEHELWLALSNAFPETITSIRSEFQAHIPFERIHVYDVPPTKGELLLNNGWRIRAAERVREYAIAQLQPDILYVSSLFEGLDDGAITSINTITYPFSTSTTLYDLIPLIRAETYLENKTVRAWYYRKIESLKQAALLLSISESSRQEALKLLEFPDDRVVTISTAADSHFQSLTFSDSHVQAIRNRYGLMRSFVMYTGGIDSRKNIEGLIQAYGQLPDEVQNNYQLAIVCSIKPHERERLLVHAKRHKLDANNIVFTGFVPEEDLVALYNLCELFVFPSLHEGFGLPALEAMSCGAAVIGSNTSSIPEVIGRDDALFDPNKLESITQALYRALSDQKLRNSLREFAPRQAAKFSWHASARRALDAFESLYDRQQTVHQRTQVQVPPIEKPSLAFISPLPPVASGIANYSAELLPQLANYYDITLITDQPEVEHTSIEISLPTQSVDWFRENAAQFERCLYQFGNSEFHKHMFQLLEEYPGVVTMHDFYLSGVLNWMESFYGPPEAFSQELYEAHGYSSLITLFTEGCEAALLKYPSNTTVINDAIGVIVHSQSLKDVAQKWYSKNIDNKWQVIPQIYSKSETISRKVARARLGLDEQDLLFCSFGMLAPTKLNHRLIKAWLASTLSTNVQCHLVFVGENSAGEYAERLINMLDKSESERKIKITGFLNPEEYHCYLAAADTAIQLRTLSRGETSRAVLEAMFYKLPVIVNAHGTNVDYPDDVLIKLSDQFSNEELVEALEKVCNDIKYRENLSIAGHNYLIENHSPKTIGQLYHSAIEKFSINSSYTNYQKFLKALPKVNQSEDLDFQESDLIAVAQAITQNTPQVAQKQLLVDVSSLISGPSNGNRREEIQHVVISLLRNPSEKYRIEPVYFDGVIYRYARQFTLNKLNIPLRLDDTPVEIHGQDRILGLDTLSMLTESSYQTLAYWHQIGISSQIWIIDALPTELPAWIVDRQSDFKQAWKQCLSGITNRVVCSSRKLMETLEENNLSDVDAASQTLKIQWCNLRRDTNLLSIFNMDS